MKSSFLKPLNTGTDEDLPIKADYFIQNQVFPLPESLLTSNFIYQHVPSVNKRSLLLDKRQPPLKLVGTVGAEGLHIFDKS